MVYPNGPNHLPMVGTIHDKERDPYYQNDIMDPDCSESNVTESRRKQTSKSLERGEEKWSREHTQRKETDPISEEDWNLLEDTDR